VGRKKPPALTSPGKVGLLVALMMVVTALGVSYFISGNFGLQWNWIDLTGASPTEWKFSAGAFLDEMVPLIALVMLLAFAAHVLVAGAVRRYQASVSSGSEYRELLRSFKSADDFDDENRLDELKQHPELRDFVMSFKNRLAARERQLEEREKRSKEGGKPRTAAATPNQGNWAGESAVLLHAIVESSNGFEDNLSLSIPELKQIASAVRAKFSRSAPADDSAKKELDSLRRNLDATLGRVRDAAASARGDASACVSGLRELDGQIAALKQAIDGLAVPAATTNNVAAATKRIDAVAESLATLGEETKRVAIAAALSASGGGGEGDAIKVADEMRTIATRFNGVAQQWRETSPVLRSAVETIASGAVGAEKRRAAVLTALESVVNKTRLWGERLVALAEAVNGVDRAAGGSTPSKPTRAAAAPASAPAPAAPAPEDWGNLRENLAADLEDRTEPPSPLSGDMGGDTEDEDFVTQRAANVFEDTSEETGFADIPGFEKEKNLFTDESGQKRAHHEHDVDPRFVVEREAGGEWNLERGTEAAETARSVDASHDGRRAKAQPTEDDGFLTGPKGAPAATPAARPTKPSRRIKVDDIAAAAPIDADADAVDLYALGAVDWTAAHA
jgi:hypothetical protein